MAWTVIFSKASTCVWASARGFVKYAPSQWEIIYYCRKPMIAEEIEGKLLIL